MNFCGAIQSYFLQSGKCSETNPPNICSLPGYLTYKERLFKAKINPLMDMNHKEHILYTHDLLQSNVSSYPDGSWTQANYCTLPDGKTIADIGYKPQPTIPFLANTLPAQYALYVPPFIQMFISAELFMIIVFIILVVLILIANGYVNASTLKKLSIDKTE